MVLSWAWLGGRALQESDLGINPSNDGERIRLGMPPLTEVSHLAMPGSGLCPRLPRPPATQGFVPERSSMYPQKEAHRPDSLCLKVSE